MSDVKSVSDLLFDEFRKIVPPPVGPGSVKARKFRPQDVAAALGRFNDQARQLRKQYRLGVVARARVVLALQREMSAAGYATDLTRQVLFSLIVSAFIGKA